MSLIMEVSNLIEGIKPLVKLAVEAYNARTISQSTTAKQRNYAEVYSRVYAAVAERHGSPAALEEASKATQQFKSNF